MLSQIRRDLPHTPDEVIEVWLVPHARRAGWPPTETNGWRIILGLDYTFARLKSLRWQRQTFAFEPTMLTARHLAVTVGLFQTYVLNHSTEYSVITDGPARFSRCCEFLKEHGVFPQPIILEAESDGLHVLDGHHRLTAFFFLYGHFTIDHPDVPCLNVRAEQEAWVAEAT